LLIGSITASQPSKLAPEVITKNIVSKTETTATLLGSLTNNSVGVTAQGFYYGYNTGGTALTINELKTGGAGITNLSTSVTPIKNNFTADITSLPSSKLISYAAFATNSVGTTDGSVLTFTTDTPPPITINRISGTEYVIVPVIEDTSAVIDQFGRNTDEIDNRNVGYGSYFKTSGDCLIAMTAPSSDGIRNNATDVSQLSSASGTGITFSPTGPTLRVVDAIQLTNNGYQTIENMAANTSYQVTIPAIGSIASKTIRINNGTPSGTYYTSTLNLNLSGVFVGKLDSGEYEYNTSPNPAASYILGPIAAGETAQAIIPLNDSNTLLTAVADTAFKSSFNPENLTVTVTGKTEGVDFDYYVEDSSTAMFGIVPGIIFVGTPELLGSTPTVNITYTP
jgi:hypothetical protein